MPYPFVLPTTSAFSFSSSFCSESHPSLTLNASTHRGLVRETLKKHKRLPPPSQASHLSSVVSSLSNYLPYLFAVEAGLSHRPVHGTEISVIGKAAPAIEWRPTLTDAHVPGRVRARVKITSLQQDIFFSLSSLGQAKTLQARAALQPLYMTAAAPVGTEARQTAIATASRHLVHAAAMYDYLCTRCADEGMETPPCLDISPSTVRALRELALAEANLVAVLKDDPYPAIVAADRNDNDTEWMYKAPDIPKVRAHLFARLCLAAAEHAAAAHGLAAAQPGLDHAFVRYLDHIRQTSRARACRFFAIDAELGGQTGTAIAWLWAARQELGVSRKTDGRRGGFGRMKKVWIEKREDRKIEKGVSWGADAGQLEEMRVVEMLETKWTKQNDTMFTQPIPPVDPLLAQMPSGRDMHTLKTFQPPVIEVAVLEAMRAPPERPDDLDGYTSSEDDLDHSTPVGTFPGTQVDYRDGGRSTYF